MAIKLWEKIADRLSITTAGATIEGRSPKFWIQTSKYLYGYLNHRLENAPEITFLNYGYAPLNGERITLDSKDEINRVYIQLYHSVAGGVDLRGLNVLEISCGRGGGAKYIKQYLKPRFMVGVDLAKKALTFCRKNHVAEGLRFACGNALDMPVAEGSVDAVVNIEASHDYPDLPRFLSEVKRVLKPRGHFLYTDFRKKKYCGHWREQLMASGLTLVQEEDISRNVLKGLEQNTEHNSTLIRKLAPWLLRPVFYQFAGVKGSYVYKGFDSDKMKYVRYVFRKD